MARLDWGGLVSCSRSRRVIAVPRRSGLGLAVAGLMVWMVLGSAPSVAAAGLGLIERQSTVGQDSKGSAPVAERGSRPLPEDRNQPAGEQASDGLLGPGEAGSAPTPLDHLPALLGDYFRLDSRAVGRPFHIYVRLPEGFETGTERRYPVVYLLDGDSLFPILAPTHLFLAYDLGLPEAIVVGIAYGSFDRDTNKRGFDYTVPSPIEGEERGGAEAFHRFLTTELIPRIEGRFSADPARRILFGQSRGGSLVLYSAFEHPDVFWGRIASNPVFEPGREIFFSAVTSPAKRTDLGLVITSGSSDRPGLRVAAMQWREAWPSDREAPWDHEVLTIEGGTHSADSARSYRQGMAWLFCRDLEASRDDRLCAE